MIPFVYITSPPCLALPCLPSQARVLQLSTCVDSSIITKKHHHHLTHTPAHTHTFLHTHTHTHMIVYSLKILVQRQPVAARSMKQRVIQVSRLMELSLYQQATSMEEYLDLTTLRLRLRQISTHHWRQRQRRIRANLQRHREAWINEMSHGP